MTLRCFEGAVAIVTGGASGIGRALAEEMAARGARVVLADLQVELAEEVASGIRSRGGQAAAATLDVTDFAAVEALVHRTVEEHGRLDYMFNNAGIAIGGEVHLYQAEDWDRVLDVCLRGVTHGVQAAYPVMIKQGYGHIVNTASMAGLAPMPMAASYCAAKHGVVALSGVLRMEAASFGVRVSVLCPGSVRTPILDDGGKYGEMLADIPRDVQLESWEQTRPMDPKEFARRTLRAVARNRAVIIVPGWWRILWWIHRLSPSLFMVLWRRIYLWQKRQWGI